MLRGCAHRCGLTSEISSGTNIFSTFSSITPDNKWSGQKLSDLNAPPPFALHESALNGTVIPPLSVGKIGPLYFRPTSTDLVTTTIYLRNNVTLLEPITLTGIGTSAERSELRAKRALSEARRE